MLRPIQNHRASDWKLDEPDWTGRMRIVAKGKDCIIKIEDKTSGQLFAQCPVDKYPGVAIEAVSDSSRYFVIKIVNDNGQSAFIGIGFADRGDSFDVNVALQDHFKYVSCSLCAAVTTSLLACLGGWRNKTRSRKVAAARTTRMRPSWTSSLRRVKRSS